MTCQAFWGNRSSAKPVARVDIEVLQLMSVEFVDEPQGTQRFSCYIQEIVFYVEHGLLWGVGAQCVLFSFGFMFVLP